MSVSRINILTFVHTHTINILSIHPLYIYHIKHPQLYEGSQIRGIILHTPFVLLLSLPQTDRRYDRRYQHIHLHKRLQRKQHQKHSENALLKSITAQNLIRINDRKNNIT